MARSAVRMIVLALLCAALLPLDLAAQNGAASARPLLVRKKCCDYRYHPPHFKKRKRGFFLFRRHHRHAALRQNDRWAARPRQRMFAAPGRSMI